MLTKGHGPREGDVNTGWKKIQSFINCALDHMEGKVMGRTWKMRTKL